MLADELSTYRGKVSLILTSPPFPLNRKKRYGNLSGEKYIEWLAGFSNLFRRYLKPRGSIVIELGNAWEPGAPAMSTLGLEALLRFKSSANLVLCEQFIWHNPARLPSPIQWVNVERVRVKDAFTHIWWLARRSDPVANNRHVLVPYSKSMRNLLETRSYNGGRRPSEHNIGETSFLRNNGGAIPSNVLTYPNTGNTDDYHRHCRAVGLKPHPARMPIAVAEFFVNFLTKPGDLILDPFAGSNTTGAAAERLGRRWLAVEGDASYIEGSKGRFTSISTPAAGQQPLQLT